MSVVPQIWHYDNKETAHIHQLSQKDKSKVLTTTEHIILTASSGVADKLRTGSQPIPSKLTDKIGEQATPTDPGI